MTERVKLTVKRMGMCWWIVGADEPCGPYDTRAEAEDDRKGLQDYYDHREDPKFWVSDRL